MKKRIYHFENTRFKYYSLVEDHERINRFALYIEKDKLFDCSMPAEIQHVSTVGKYPDQVNQKMNFYNPVREIKSYSENIKPSKNIIKQTQKFNINNLYIEKI